MTSPSERQARPCPFCNGTELTVEEIENEFAVMCDNCGAVGPPVENVKDAANAAMQLAIIYWNGAPHGPRPPD